MYVLSLTLFPLQIPFSVSIDDCCCIKAHECVCDSWDTNLSDFNVFTGKVTDNNRALPLLKQERDRIEAENDALQEQVDQLKILQQQLMEDEEEMPTAMLKIQPSNVMLQIPNSPLMSSAEVEIS